MRARILRRRCAWHRIRAELSRLLNLPESDLRKFARNDSGWQRMYAGKWVDLATGLVVMARTAAWDKRDQEQMR